MKNFLEKRSLKTSGKSIELKQKILL
jgi:hypothetical protein